MVLVEARECASERQDCASPSKMATLGLSKVFILDKYFTELQKFWETEKKLQAHENDASAGAMAPGKRV
ncbi:putative myosin x [Anopheles sinensis]|uniref:Putative myosin x n=1 Tax=Anopheles sinensis TaxID=74873 RepID=A0A084W8S0_ANOSI|nr:putative myosin x [Anopheles sinensis]